MANKRTAEKEIKRAARRVDEEITGMSAGMSIPGLAREGYAGGYLQGLRDAMLAMDGVQPNTRTYWLDWGKTRK